ncbi:MAG: phospholipid carrier-dependent glycosyltransferase [Acidobacteria bacterium]|nr:phospholipid carrier-dependent glycosyltransferase [Acidobacteriota bacterium]
MNKSTLFLPRILVIFMSLVLLLGVFGRDMWTPDEPRATAISMEMARTGNLVIPKLAGQPFLEKPPLYFAVAAGAIHFPGRWTGPVRAVRLTSWLWMMGVLWMVFLLVNELSDTKRAWWTVLVLAVFPGFMLNAIWIRVDAALAFFVVASLMAFARAYSRDRLIWFFWAGLFLGGSFLAKGPIGPILTFIGWVPLFLTFCWIPHRNDLSVSLRIPWLLLAAALAALLAGIWAILLYHQGGAELFHEWFFENQLGRFAGSIKSLGHIHAGNPLYYVAILAFYIFPFLVLLAGSIKRGIQTMWRREMPNPLVLMGLVWGLGSLVFLSIPATKRGVYLLPVLPAYAMLVVIHPDFFSGQRRFRWSRIWIALSISLSLLILFLPLASGYAHLPPSAANALTHSWGWYGASAVAILSGLLFLFGPGRQAPQPARVAVSAIMIYAALMLYPFHIIDTAKELKSQVQTFTRAIPRSQRPHLAGMDLSETMRGALVVYAGWDIFSTHDTLRVRKILEGKDKEFDGLIFTSRSSSEILSHVPFRVVSKGPPGERQLFRIQGDARIKDHSQKEGEQ